MSRQAVLCVFNVERISENLLSVDGLKEMKDLSGNPIRIRALTPILTVREDFPGRLSKRYVVYHGYKGEISEFSIHPLGMIKMDDRIEGGIKLRQEPIEKLYDSNCVRSSTGEVITVYSGSVVAILQRSTGLATGPDGSKYSKEMVKIGFCKGDDIYVGWIRERYLQRFYRE